MSTSTDRTDGLKSEPGELSDALAGGGEMGALMRSMDWTKTPVGHPLTWPQSLRTAVSILLESRFPMYIAWGPKFVQFYNDGYRLVLGTSKHPAAMGGSAETTFAESWHIIGPMFEGVRGGQAVGSEDWMLPLDRNGYLEECYFTFSYSPIRDESGGVGGVLVTVTETTGRVLGERRLRTLRDLAARTATVKLAADAWTEAANALAGNAFDLSFALLYRASEPGHPPLLSATTGWDLAVGSRFDSALASSSWPFDEVATTLRPRLVSGLRARFGELPGGKWPEAPNSALVLPILRAGTDRPYGFLVAGLSPRRAVDDNYRGFLGLIADQVATALTNASAFEEEKKRAEALAELDRAKTAFFSNVSHEFRTPLTLMLGPIEDGLADTAHPLPPEQRERQELVRRNGQRLQKLVNTLLDFARHEAGRAQAAFVPTDLAALTTDLASSFTSAMTAGGLKLVIDCPTLPRSVYVDPEMWEKIVLNLLSNALKFTFKGEVRVALRGLGETVELTVEDTGTGVAAAELPRIFERFHRVEGAPGRSFEGTGIGLALVRELVKLHRGTVTVKSVLGEGSTFTVSLPTNAGPLPRGEHPARTLASTGIGPASFLAEVSQWNLPTSESTPASTAAPASSSSVARSQARILVVDDNADLRAYLSRLLSEQWQVESASEGMSALAAARANPPDLVICDVMMPGMNGLELVAALRADERTRTIPVLLLSARAGEEATIEGLESGADEYLVKPFSARELRARVHALLTISQLRQAAILGERAHAEEAGRLLEVSRTATRAREQTLAVVSHDLRSPLSAIRASTDLLQRNQQAPDLAARVNKHAELTRRSATRMNRLIDDLLDLASIDSGTLSVASSAHTADELVREARELFEPQANEKGISLITLVEPGLALHCDKERILQVLGNLLSNALKFTPAGGTVNLQARAEPGTQSVGFFVADTGTGISVEAQPRIFERYWHGAQQSREGHGLGLAIARGLVETHGGQLRLDSSSSAGSTFSFVLPCEPKRQPTPAHLSPALRLPGASESFVQGGGEMGALMRSFDWATTDLGRLEDWPQSLRTSVSTMLRSPYPIILFWGPERRMLYNDPFRPILGAKHPATLGARGHEALAEEWALLGPLMQRVQETGEPLFIQNGNVNFQRRPGGLREEAYFTWSYNPTIGETGEIAGLFAIASETTGQVVGERQLAVLRELSIRTALATRPDDIFQALQSVLAQAGGDLPFSMLYVIKDDTARLVSCTGLIRGSPAAPEELELSEGTSWPLAQVASSGADELVEGLQTKFGALPGGPWPEPSTRALVLPVPMGADRVTTAVLVAGLSPLRALDQGYRGFLQLLARQLAASLSSARAYAQERERAEALAQLDQAKTAFFNNVSHEFRTPLTLILGPIEDALAHKNKVLEGSQLELVRRNALRLHKMVNTLLDFSRMEAGRAQATYVPTDLAAFTRDLASTFESAAAAAKLRLYVDCVPLPEAIYVDPDMWEKIVLNLLSNAVKYTHRGEIRVGLCWKDDSAILTVADTGVGIPDQELPRVFERFYRVRSTAGRSHEGTGIGLALVQELVGLHGGSVGVTSTLGEGTTFTVRMPRGSAHLPVERVERTPRPRSTATGAPAFVSEAQRWSAELELPAGEAAQRPAPNVLSPSRILLVDDNGDLRSYVAGLLRQAYSYVETATNGEQALAQIRAQPPDLVLSDVMMPGLDGFALVRALRAEPETRAIPVILLSARAGDESAVEGLESGADDYLVKPFSARELMARVRTQLEMARVRREEAHREAVEQQLHATLKARDEWLTLVGHELRTPLTALSLSIHSLLRGAGSPATPNQATADAVHRNLERLTRQVENLVDVSEIVSGRLKIIPQPVDLAALTAGVVRRLEKAAVGRSPLMLGTATPVLGAYDPERITQLVESLLDNASKFAMGRPIEVSVTQDSEHAQIRIVDHGPGIAPEDHARVFGRFQRGVSTQHFGGFGLGLWVARHIAEAHEGKLELTQTQGGGATFTVKLPLSTDTTEERSA